MSSITLETEAADSDATLSVSPSVDADPTVDGQQVNLDAGENVITVTVTAENGVSERTYTVTVTRSSGPPGAPRYFSLVTYDDGELNIEWRAPLYDGGSEITGYKVQWKSGTEEWDSSRQYDLKVDDLNSNRFGVYSRKIYPLTNDVEYTLRVLAYNEYGDGTPSTEITGTPTSLKERLKSYIDDEIIDEYGDDHTWLSQAWNHMTRNSMVFDLVSGVGFAGTVHPSCPVGSDGLAKCIVTRTELNAEVFLSSAKDTLDKVIIHELAHYFDFTHTLSDKVSLAAFRLYVHSLGLYVDPSGRCETLELLADLMTLSVDGDAPVSYWKSCNSDSALTTAAVAVARTALGGTIPTWFGSTYNDDNGDPDLESVWSDVKNLESYGDRAIAVYQLRNSFGGYCSNARAYASAQGDGPATNPWRDGGCVPDAPLSISAVPAGDGKLAVSWQKPDGDGGFPVKGYRVQWKSGQELYDSSRKATLNSKKDYVSHTIGGLTNGVEYDIRVRAYNENGNGTSGEVSATPSESDEAVPVLNGATVVGDSLVLAYNEELDENSVPAATAFAVTVGEGTGTVSGVTVSKSKVTLSLDAAVSNGDTVSVSYTAAADPIQDESGNDAANFADVSVTNNTPVPSRDATLSDLWLNYRGTLESYTPSDVAENGASHNVPSTIETVSIFATPNDSGASVEIDSPLAQSDLRVLPDYFDENAPSTYVRDVPVNVGENVVTVTVTAEDGATQETYVLTLVGAPDAPGTPQHVSAYGLQAVSDSIRVTWLAPLDDGGGTITGYKVQWKSGSQNFDVSRQAVASVGTGEVQSHTVSSLVNGTEYTVRVAATNSAGDGAYSAEVKATPGVTTTPQLHSASVDSDFLVLTYDKALDTSSVPATSAFTVSVGGSDVTVSDVEVSAYFVTLTLDDAAAAGDAVTVSYTVPTGSSASPIEDLSGNAASGFSDENVTNETPAVEVSQNVVALLQGWLGRRQHFRFSPA